MDQQTIADKDGISGRSDDGENCNLKPVDSDSNENGSVPLDKSNIEISQFSTEKDLQHMKTRSGVSQFAAEREKLQQQIAREQEEMNQLILKEMRVREQLVVQKLQRSAGNHMELMNLSPMRVSA